MQHIRSRLGRAVTTRARHTHTAQARLRTRPGTQSASPGSWPVHISHLSFTQLSNHSSARLTSPALAAASQQYEGIYSNLHASCPRRSSCPSHLMSPLSVRIACSTHPARTVRGHQTQRSSTSLSPGPTPSPQPEPLPRLPIASRSSSRSSLLSDTPQASVPPRMFPLAPSRLSTQPFRPLDGGG